MVTREDDWDSPSEGERKSVWDETERKYMVDLRSEEDAENKKIEEDFQLLNHEFMLKFSEHKEQRSQLKELQSRLARDLAQAEAKLEHITNECKETASRLERIEQDYHSSLQKTTETFHDKRSKMRRFFRQKRGENPDTPDHLGPESEGIILPETEHQAAWTTAPQPERRPKHQTEKVPDRPNERFHNVTAAKVPERTVEVAPIQIDERPCEMSHRPAYGPPLGPPSRPTTAFRSDYVPERMIDPVDSPLPTPIYPQTRPVLPSSVLRRSPHEILHPSTELDGPARDYRGSDSAHISRENMVLKNDGNVYTYPECVAGVPLVKIDEQHPYWEAHWPNVKEHIKIRLNQQRKKRQDAIEANPLNCRVYSIDHEINRCKAILEFLEKGPISPCQLLSKKYIKRGIKAFDTLFRLSKTISELEKFNLDISPVEWIRQRLYEIIQTQGDRFKLSATLQKLHHDFKFTRLRYKHDFENNGRPSRAMKARLSHGSPSNTPKPLQKRKSMHSVPTTPQEDSFINHSPPPSQAPPSYPAPVPTTGPQPAVSTHLNKKPKSMPPTHESPVHDEFHFEAWSDTDSCSGGSVTKYEWRLAVVKTRLYTSHINVTQYWSWIVQTQCFQHQVLKDIKPAKWGLFKDEIDFHVNLAAIEEIEWSIEALRVHIIMKKDARELAADGEPRGDIMASFLRARTMRRYLFFCREKGIKMAKRAPEQLHNTWESMVSEQLPGRGDSNQQLVE